MFVLDFYRSYGDEIKKSNITFDLYGRNMYQLFINGYHQGYFYFRDGRWHADLAPKSTLQSEDISIIGEIIEANYWRFEDKNDE